MTTNKSKHLFILAKRLKFKWTSIFIWLPDIRVGYTKLYFFYSYKLLTIDIMYPLAGNGLQP